MGRLRRFGVAVGMAGAAQLVAAPAARGQDRDPPPVAAYPPPPRLVEPMAAPGAPRVILEVDRPYARLQVRVPGNWVAACEAPCGLSLDPSRLYRVGGAVTVSSRPFKLPAEARDVVVRARTGSAAVHWTGFGMMIWGAALVAGSLFFYAVSGIGEPRSPHAFRNTEIVMALGAGIGVAGVPLWFSSYTSVEVH